MGHCVRTGAGRGVHGVVTMNEWYKRKADEAEAKAKAAAEMGDYDEYTRWNREVENYRRMVGE